MMSVPIPKLRVLSQTQESIPQTSSVEAEESIYGSRTLRDQEDVERLAEAYLNSISGRFLGSALVLQTLPYVGTHRQT